MTKEKPKKIRCDSCGRYRPPHLMEKTSMLEFDVCGIGGCKEGEEE